MQFADHITCRVLGVDEVLASLEPRSESGRRRAREPVFFGPDQHAEWAQRRVLQEQANAWWTAERAGELGPAFEALPTLERPLRVLESGAVLDDTGFFELKRFLFHAAKLVESPGSDLIDPTWHAALLALMTILHPQQQPTPRFQLSAKLDARLVGARAALKAARTEERQRRQSLEDAVRAAWGGSFDVHGRYSHDEEISDPRLRPVADGKFELVDDELEAAADAHADRESELHTVEADVRAKLSAALREHTTLLIEVRDALAELDVFCAMSELCSEWDGSWPTWGEAHAIWDGRHPRLRDDVQPISITFATDRPAVVTGPNMGGKSMLLRLTGLCQWLAQHGFCVPAQRCEFRPVARLVYVGADADDRSKPGLSSFGREVRRVVDHLGLSPTFWLLDEFARGTHPDEGAAIARDFIQARHAAGDRVLAATHFPMLARHEPAAHFQIAGLTEPLEALEVADLDRIEEALRAAMDYTPIERSAADSSVPRDARRVARALGLRFATDPESP